MIPRGTKTDNVWAVLVQGQVRTSSNREPFVPSNEQPKNDRVKRSFGQSDQFYSIAAAKVIRREISM